VYAQSWVTTVVKWGVLGWAYSIVLSFALLAAFVGAIFMV
jgi:hypothetical protein